tara:strand:- start:338 stop:544 length:207 start_codon:yes stop_codon:yes gene_type:complete
MNKGIKIIFKEKIELKTIDDNFSFEINIKGDFIYFDIYNLDEVDHEGNKSYEGLYQVVINKFNGETCE